jgi:hypothetical protein
MNTQHFKNYSDTEFNSDDYEEAQLLQEKYNDGYSPIYRSEKQLTGCKRLRSERALDIDELAVWHKVCRMGG